MPLPETFFWGIYLLIGYFGIGNLFLLKFLNVTSTTVDISLKVTAGICLSILASSVLMLFSIGNYQGLFILTLLSFIAGLYFTSIYLKEFIKKHGHERLDQLFKFKSKSNLYLLAPLLFTILAFVSSVYWPYQFDPNDDWIAYLAFPEKLLQNGTLIEPFSSRRILGLCGQSLLLAQIMIIGEPECAHLLDRGFGVLLLFGLLVNATRGIQPRWQLLRCLFIFAAITSSVPRINTASSLLGIALLFGLLLVISRFQNKTHWSFRDCILPAVILAGASSLRPTFAIVGGGILIVFFAMQMIDLKPKKSISTISPLFLIGIITFGLLGPLMAVSYLSSKTPIFPFFTGNAAPEFIYWNSGKGFFEDAKIAINFMLMPEMLVMTIGMLLVFILKGNVRRLAFSVALVTVLIVFISSVKTSGTANSWIMDLYRYSFPLYAVAFFWVLSKSLEIDSGDHVFSGPVMAGVMVAVFWSSQLAPAVKEIQMELEVLPLQSTGFTFPTAALKPFYDDLQNKVPPGQKIFAVVDAPYLLNYKRNPISNVDVVAYASPSPGMPFHQGPDALRSYLVSLGYKYLLAVDFNKAVFLYNRKAMENHPRPEYREHAKHYVLDFLNNVDALSEKSTIARNDNARLISL
jgi:hypothetical protein